MLRHFRYSKLRKGEDLGNGHKSTSKLGGKWKHDVPGVPLDEIEFSAADSEGEPS
jgi:hypothetical protein